MKRIFDAQDYEAAFELAQELHDNGREVSVEMHDCKITVMWEERDE